MEYINSSFQNSINNKHFRPGQLIKHTIFGQGIIIQKEEVHDKIFLTIKFDNYPETKKVLDTFVE